MKKGYRSPEEKQHAPAVEAEAKQDAAAPDLVGFGIQEVEGGFIAYRCTTRGKVDVLNQRLGSGRYRPSPKYMAMARIQRAQEDEFVLGRPRKKR